MKGQTGFSSKVGTKYEPTINDAFSVNDIFSTTHQSVKQAIHKFPFLRRFNISWARYLIEIQWITVIVF